MMKLGVGLAVAILVLSVATLAAWQGGRATASSEPLAESAVAPPAAAAPQPDAGSGEDGEGEVRKHRYIGVAARTLSAAESEKLGIPGGVQIEKVDPHGPSAGLLEVGDVIIAINGVEVTNAEGVVETVRSTDGVLTIRVLRNGEKLDLQVEPVERDVPSHTRFKQSAEYGPEALHGLWKAREDLVRLELVRKTDDGFETINVYAGLVSNLDAEVRSFTLTGEDGLSVDLQGDEKTMVITSHEGNFGGLDGVTRTLVVVKDNVVALVVQIEGGPGQLLHGLGAIFPALQHSPFQPQLGGFQRQGDFPRFGGLPQLREHGLQGIPLERLEGGEFDIERFLHALPPELRELIERLKAGQLEGGQEGGEGS